MMVAALEGLKEGSKNNKMPLLIGVTILTSISENELNNDLLIDNNIEDVVLEYSKNAKESGLDGVVCSPLESIIIHKKIGNDFLTVTPGIRIENGNNEDQKRVTTPKKAKEFGSDFIVVGRTITNAKNPLYMYDKCVKDFL